MRVVATIVACSLTFSLPAGSHAQTSPAQPMAENSAPATRVPMPERNPRRPVSKGPVLPLPPAEKAYRARLAKLLRPLLEPYPQAAELDALRAAIRSRSAVGLSDPVARKLATWNALMAGIGEPEAFVAFDKANPFWPGSHVLERNAEDQLFIKGGSSAAIRAFFKGREPVSGVGWASLASAYLAEGDEAKARTFARKAWEDVEMPPTLETGFLERFGKYLTAEDHRHRLDLILVDRVRFRAARRERAAIARRIIRLLPEADQKQAETRLLVFLRNKAAIAKVVSLPYKQDGKTDWGLAYAHAIAFLRKDDFKSAAQILSNLPADSDKLVSPDDWWLARREAAYDALKARRPQLAYALVRQKTPLSENPAKEQAHMAGWIALRLLKKPDLAITHFKDHIAVADGPLSRARSHYWMGRALEAKGRRSEALKFYREATREQDTFHALLATLKIAGTRQANLEITLPAMPTSRQVQHFLGLDSVRAAILAVRAGLPRNIAMGLFAATRNALQNEGELALLAELASTLGDTQTSLRIGKSAIARRLNLTIYAYPLEAWPEYKPLGPPPETAMMLSIARQETEFNTAIVSSAGARGLLQVMPITARHVCRDYKLKCDIPRLMTDHGYNAMIATAYIGDRMREFGGWYVVTLAGYNAGPGRARQWMRENGDPRTAAVDPIDWIERIPIEETRNYVQKVLSNIQIYRARLGEPKPVRLLDDLYKPSDVRRASAD
ncbi:MAG: transglycosylase SLT domain-containing protein [Hyphomicrobiaceae bacterium]